MVEKLDITKIKGRKILAVGAHPDDLEFSAGGALALLSGDNLVTILLTTDGGAGAHDPKMTNGEMAKTREAEAREAGKKLGVSEVVFFNYPDLELQNWRRHFFRKFLKYLVKARPDIVISWDYWGRYEPLVHPDHRTTGEVVMEAILEGTLPGRLKKWGVGGLPLDPKPQHWLMAPADPSHVVDVSGVWETKWEAIKEHKSQVSGEEVKKVMEEKWFGPVGKMIGVRVGEPFRVMMM